MTRIGKEKPLTPHIAKVGTSQLPKNLKKEVKAVNQFGKANFPMPKQPDVGLNVIYGRVTYPYLPKKA